MEQKTVLVITSHVVRGRVGGRGAVFALERLGFDCWSLPTVTLPWHPGHGATHRYVPDPADFSKMIEDLKHAPWLGDLSAILTGYLGDASQALVIADLVKTARAANPNLLYACDPVIGDGGGLYVPSETAEAMRDVLVPVANLITPNRFEFDWLTGKSHALNEDILETVKIMPQARIAVTSAFAMMKNSQGSLLYDRASDGAYLAEHRAFDQAPNGPGDLFAALLLARLLQELPPEKALQTATAGVFDILAQTVKAEADELLLVREQSRLERPMAMVNIRRIGGQVVRKKGLVVKPTPLT